MLITLVIGSFFTVGGIVTTALLQFSNIAEATVVSIVNDRYMVDVDDSSVKKYSDTHAAVGIKVFLEKHGWGNYFVIDIDWSKGIDKASAHRVDNGAEMESDLAQTVAKYLK